MSAYVALAVTWHFVFFKVRIKGEKLSKAKMVGVLRLTSPKHNETTGFPPQQPELCSGWHLHQMGSLEYLGRYKGTMYCSEDLAPEMGTVALPEEEYGYSVMRLGSKM